MELQFTPEQQAQLTRLAIRTGTQPESLAAKIVMRYLDDEMLFLAAVEKGIAAAACGEFVEEDEMSARVEAMFRA